MADHIIVIFDRSGSMGRSFLADKEATRQADFVGDYETKIQAAQDRLIDRLLKKSQHEVATIIPFHSVVEPSPFNGSISKQSREITQYIKDLTPAGGTNLADALRAAIDIGLAESQASFVKYLIITDGLSDTINEDLTLVSQIPKIQSIDGILIDPTDRGEAHLKALCLRGHYISVSNSKQLDKALDQQSQRDNESIAFNKEYAQLAESNEQMLTQLESLIPRLNGYPKLHNKLDYVITHALDESNKLTTLKEEIADHATPNAKIKSRIDEIAKNNSNTETLVQLIERSFQQVPKFQISISHPKKLSKRLTSPFLIYIYPIDKKQEVEVQLTSQLKEWGLKERIYDSDLTSDLTVIIKLSSSNIEFSDEVVKRLQQTANHVSFIAQPNDTCFPGRHPVNLSIRDKASNVEYQSITFPVNIVDFVFDHISRPFISNLITFILGVGAFVTFILTFLGQIDTSFGLTSGTTAGTLAAILYARFFNLYRRVNTTINQP